MSLRGEFSRATGVREAARNVRAAFRKASGAKIALSTAAKVMRSADQTRAKVEAHFEKHQAKWTNKRYGELLLKSAMSRAPAPPGMTTDPKQRLMTQARAEVVAKRNQRLGRLERARDNMLQSGRIRASRKVDWGKGLGE